MRRPGGLPPQPHSCPLPSSSFSIIIDANRHNVCNFCPTKNNYSDQIHSRRDTELSNLHVFRTVVSSGGVTRAADRLHRVQSNVTTRVRKLEEDLGVELFVREGRRLQLSPAGNVLLGYADRLLALASEARKALHESGPRGVLRLGSMESTAAARLPRPSAWLAKRHPALTVELRTGTPCVLIPVSSMANSTPRWWPSRSMMRDWQRRLPGSRTTSSSPGRGIHQYARPRTSRGARCSYSSTAVRTACG